MKLKYQTSNLFEAQLAQMEPPCFCNSSGGQRTADTGAVPPHELVKVGGETVIDQHLLASGSRTCSLILMARSEP